MNKTAIKNFAIWARRKLIADITYKAGLIGVTENGIAAPLPQSKADLQFFDIGTKNYAEVSGKEVSQRAALVSAIRDNEKTTDYKTAFQNVIEEVAYTWFNRLIAVRFMEVNDYLPSRVRVLSSENPAKYEPDFVTTPFETDLDFSPYERDRAIQLKDENELNELFRMLFIKQCNKLHEILPELFEKTDDYTELLLAISFTDKDDVVYHLVHDIAEDDFNVAKEGQVEIIGWMYQYYNTEPKDEVFALLKKNVKITKERIPAATQLFTPDWIVRYMVENSLGRLWVEGHPNDALKSGWKYYLEEAQQEPDVQAQLEKIRAEYKTINPEDIKLIDPCMGSGHILVYAFDVLMQIYVSCGYTERDAAAKILENNLYGLDIDERAYQLAYFAMMMKARQYDRRFFTRDVKPNLYAPGGYTEGQELGSLLTVGELEPKPEPPKELTLFNMDYEDRLNTWNFRRLLAQKYDVVVTNPPYMGLSGMNSRLCEYVKDSYQMTKMDLFSCFIERAFSFAKQDSLISLITMESWMFLASFEKLRYWLLSKKTISTMVHMPYLGKGRTSLGINFGTSATVFRNSSMESYSAYYDYICYYDIDDDGVPLSFPVKSEREGYTKQYTLKLIPGAPIAYWVSENVHKAFKNAPLEQYSISDGQNVTSNNDRFVRFHWEVSSNTIGGKNKWRLYAKGGDFRRWYGNLINVIDWSDSAIAYYHKESSARVIPEYLWYREGITWGLITSAVTSFRLLPSEATFDKAGSSIFIADKKILYYLALLNSAVVAKLLKILNSTISLQVKDVRAIPVVFIEVERIERLCRQCISLVKRDWDRGEISFDFSRSDLIGEYGHISQAVDDSLQRQSADFEQLRLYEKEINTIFINAYGMNSELSSDVEDKYVSIQLLTCKEQIMSFISYAVGCMFGRYSLDVDGLAYAGGEWDSSKYKTYLPDADNCIPITDEEYFQDDIVGRFVEFIRTVYGAETLEENLDFIAKALGNKGNTSREVIRNYFLNDFFRNHCQIYQKRPIYWLFDSGKQNGFKALVYMHRWNADTIGNVRVEYLHKMQRVYEKEIERMQETVENSRNAREVAAAEKRKEKLIKQLKETKDYDAKIAHLALSRIDIDLDDGVKVNYEKVQTGQDGKKIEILGKI